MNVYRDSKAIEKLLALVTVLTLISFAYYFTLSEIEELEASYKTRRVMLTKMLGREIADYLEKRIEITPRLSNFLAEEGVAYAAVQQPDGSIIAKGENYAIPMGILENIEETALKASHLISLPYEDPSRTVSLTETVLPVITPGSKKVVLRIGFFRNSEKNKVSHIKFRNTIVFSFLIFALSIIWFLRKNKASNLQNSLMGTTAIVILMLFLSSRMTLQKWYENEWHQNFTKNAIAVSKMFSTASARLIESSLESDIKEEYKIAAADTAFAYISIIKDDKIVFHSDPTQVNENMAADENYPRSLNTKKPMIFRNDLESLYEVYVPVMKGQHRLGTIKTGWFIQNSYEPLSIIRDRLVLVFTAALIILLLVMHLLSRRVTKELHWFIKAMEQVTSGDLRQTIYIDRNDEFGQLAHSFNFMIMSMKEKDMVGRGLQQYVSKSIVEKTLKALSSQDKNGEKQFAVSLFLYFSGINEAISHLDGARIFSSVQECLDSVNKLTQPGSNVNNQLFPSGILTVFTLSNRHDSLLKALNTANLIATDLGRRPDLPFSPKLTMHTMEVIRGNLLDKSEKLSFIGDGFADFRTMAKIQGGDEIIVTREVSLLLKDAVNFEELEILSPEHGRTTVYLFKNYKEISEIIRSFESATNWTKIMILRILKLSVDQVDPKILFEWFKDEDPDVRYHVMDIIDRIPANDALAFVEKVIESESDKKVLSRAIAVLGKVGNEKHIPILSEQLRSTDRRVKANAVEALELIGGKRVYEFFNLLIDEQDNRVKANILIALGKYGDLKVFDLLSKMITDQEPNMRASAAYALGQLGMAQGVEPLVNALSDKDPMVRRQVIASLTALKADLNIEM